MRQETVRAALAGLLHDVGKFAQRAEIGQRQAWTEENRKEVGYWHALASDRFVQDHVPDDLRQGLSGPRYHHCPRALSTADAKARYQAYRVQLADWLASGEHDDDEDGRIAYLRSPFSRMQGYTAPWFYPLEPLSDCGDRHALFPRAIDDASWQERPAKDYAALWDRFERACRQRLAGFREGQGQAYLEALYALLQEFTWCIPSAAYRSVPDVSLVDHSRMTAALAVCLTEDKRPAEWCVEVRDGLEADGEASLRDVALLVGGDISGVQRFIYTITSSGAAKSLRGRSFYLQLLTEAVARYVLDQLGLPITNLIYAGGGNFYLLAPVRRAADLASIQADVTERLLAAHDGGLYLALGHTAAGAAEFQRGRFHTAWQRLHEQLGRAKLKPLTSLPEDLLAQNLGRGMGVGGDTENVCSVCGRETSAGEPTVSEVSGADTIRKCGLCNSLETLGRDLANATHLVMATTAPEQREHIHHWREGLHGFGGSFWAIDASRPPVRGSYLDLPAGLGVIHLSELSAGAAHEAKLRAELARAQAPIVTSYRPFAQLVPKDERGNILTFDQLAEKAARGGLKRWGVLRMDVDNLGKLFQEGFIQRAEDTEENSLTLSRVAGLSFALRLFFEAWLPNAGRGDPELADKLYVQYAGGDDLFVVGSWDALPEFAWKVRNEFREFACHNPHVTLSGGVVLAPEKYPLYQAAQDASRAEHRAKDYTRPASRAGRGRKKDAFCFLGQTVGWEDMGKVRTLAHQLEQWCGGDDPTVSKSLLQHLLAIHGEYRRGREQALKEKKWQPGQIYFGPWMWHLAYQLARRIRDRRTPDDVGRALAQIEEDMLKDPQRVETIGLSARWAQYLVR